MCRLISSLILTALLAGCASTPTDTRQAERHDFTSQQTPKNVAACLIRNAENVSGAFSGYMRPGARPEMLEVTIRHSDAGASVIADIEPTAQGSKYALWLSHQHFMFRGTLIQMIVKGC